MTESAIVTHEQLLDALKLLADIDLDWDLPALVDEDFAASILLADALDTLRRYAKSHAAPPVAVNRGETT